MCEIIEPLLFVTSTSWATTSSSTCCRLAKYYDHAIPPGPYDDTIIVRHCLVEDLGNYNLKDLICDWFHDLPGSKRRLASIPTSARRGSTTTALDEVARYLAKDVRYCWLMFQAFYPRPRPKRGVLRHLRVRDVGVYPIVMAMEYAGFPVDISEHGRRREDLTNEQAAIKQEAWPRSAG